MKTYIEKPNFIKISQVREKKSLSSFSYRNIIFKNKNIKKLKDLLIENKKWFEPWSDNYINFSENYFVRISEMSDLNISFSVSDKTNRIIPVNWKNFLENGDICFQTASNVWNVNFYFWPKAYFNSHIRKISFDKKFYIFAILKSSFGKNQVDIWGSIKWVDNFNNEMLENIKIPFPTQHNHENPEKIEEFVSLLVQNLIDKEEQIKIKNEIIDEKIEKELNENQKEKEFVYNFPKLSEIKGKWRLDTGIYGERFKKFYRLIENYKNGYRNLELKDLNWWNTPKIRIFEPIKKEFLWLTPTDMNAGILISKKYIKAEKYNLWNKFALLFSNRSNCWECILYSPEYYNWWHHNQGIYRKIIEEENFFKDIFILNIFNSRIFQKVINNIATGATFQELRIEQFLKIPIPMFPDKKQQEIAKEYYNKIEKNTDLDFENYLQKEKARNSKMGIFQLNMEIFELREKLENIIDDIIMDRKIEIEF